MSKRTSQAGVEVEKHFTSSILLWMRNDQPRQVGMDYWSGPHSGIISASPGLEEYRQIHLAEANPGRWPAVTGVETTIPPERKIDGVAEVTFKSPLSPLAGRSQTKVAYQDEVNVFRRTLLYAGLPNSSRWYDVGGTGQAVGARSLLYLRRRDEVGTRAFRRVINKELIPALISMGILRELRTQAFMPWNRRLWDTPNVAHDNPQDQHLHASLILGFDDETSRGPFFTGAQIDSLSKILIPVVAAVHAYDVAVTLTYVRTGEILPNPAL